MPIEELPGYKSRVQISDNPVIPYNSRKIDFLSLFQKASTIASLYGLFRLSFAGKNKNGIPAGLKVVSKIPYILQAPCLCGSYIIFKHRQV